MIHELWSDRPSFKRLKFGRGLNIVLAARSGGDPEAPSEHPGRTRNGAGKSSLIDILRFMLGGDVQKKKTIVAAPILKKEAVSKLIVNEPFGADSAASPLHSRQAIFRAGRVSR